jgi:copper chaperone CopZ
MTMAGTAGLRPLAAMASSDTKTVVYHVKGFTCITCATGLDSLLGRQRGVVSSKSTYPEGKVSVSFDPEKISEKAIVAFIADLGFSVDGQPAA